MQTTAVTGALGVAGPGCKRGGLWPAWPVAAAVAVAVAFAVAFSAGPHSRHPVAARPPGASALTSHASVERLSLGEQASISSAIAARSEAFRPRRVASGYRIAGGGLSTLVRPGGVRVATGDAALYLSLDAIGRGRTRRPAREGPPIAHANRVLYAPSALREWYAAGPLGLEQGFSVLRSPAGAHGGLTLVLRVGGTLRARRSGAGVVFSRDGRAVLRYGGLAAVDAAGRPLAAGLALQRGELVLHIADRGARYPVRIDPFIQQAPKLPGNSNSLFGTSVAMSTDGQTALVGAPHDNLSAGSAWVFTHTSGTWILQAELGNCGGCVGGSGLGETGAGQFGVAVALSSDGSTALVGAPNDNSNAGAAWVFTRSQQGVWSAQSAKLPGSAGTFFGQSVALSQDGGTALVGAPGESSNTGSASVLTRSGSTWSPPPGVKLVPTCSSNCQLGGQFGSSVALSSAGDVAVIGAPAVNLGEGAAWVFANAGSWTPQAMLVGDCQSSCSGSQGTGESGEGAFGSSVSLAPDGGLALAGAPMDNSSIGAAWMFAASGGGWVQQGSKLIGNCASSCSGPNGTGENGSGQFGATVTLSRGGATLLIGAPADSSGAGAAWLFTGSPRTGWSQQSAPLVGDCTGCGEVGSGKFGSSVALSPDSGAALIGAPFDGTGAGSAWVFAQPPSCSDVSARTPAGGGAVTVSLSCAGPPGASLAYSIVGGPSRGALGTIDQGAGTVTYTSQGGTAGSDTFTYRASDSGGASTTATATITIPPTVPTCSNVSARAPAGGGAVTVSLSCTAPLGASLSYSIASGPAHGALAAIDQPNGKVTYASQSGFVGSDSFTYEASDPGGASSPAVVTIAVPPPVLHPPKVSIVGTRAPVVGVRTTYSASVIDTTATPHAFTWTVDGHVAGRQSSLGFKFTTGGGHRISLQVRDNAGQHGAASLSVRPTFRRLSISTQWTDDFTSRWTAFTSLVALAVPISTRVDVICSGGGCPFARHSLSVRSTTTCHLKKCKARKHPTPRTRAVDLSRLVVGHHLPTGTRLVIRFRLKFYVGQVSTFTITSTGPHRQVACLAPGATRPRRRC